MAKKPLSIDQALLKARTLARKGGRAPAAELFKSVLKKSPKNKIAIRGLRTLEAPSSVPPNAAVNREPSQAEITELVALIKQGRLQEALKKAQSLQSTHPLYAPLLIILGTVYGKLGHPVRAEEIYAKAIQVAPDDVETHFNLGNVFVKQGKREEALVSYTNAVEINPGHILSHFNRGNVLNDLGRHEEAIPSFANALTINPDHVAANNNLGTALCGLGRYKEAAACFSKALQIEPGYCEARYNLGNTFFALGRHEKALAQYTKTVEINPRHVSAHYNRGNVLTDMGKPEEAIPNYANALRIDPDHPKANNNLGIALGLLGRHEKSMAHFAKAVQIKPDYAEAHFNHGNAFLSLDRNEEAIACFTRAIQIKPDFAEAHCNLGGVLRQVGRNQEARARYFTALKIKPDFPVALRNLSTLLTFKKDDPRLSQMKTILTRPEISDDDKMQVNFALGKAYSDIDDVSGAFACLDTGNRLRREMLGYDPAADQKLFGLIKAAFNVPTVPVHNKADKSSAPEKQPIFIVGMPRSGTTLVEQILASHSRVFGGGELTALGRLCVPVLNAHRKSESGEPFDSALRSIGKGYLAQLGRLGGQACHVTDKMPINFRWIGFIMTAMPEARIVNLIRDPIATCWSIYKHYFTGKGNGYAYDLVDVAEYYKLYVDLMAFWREKFPGKIYDLNYETLTEDQEEETRRLLDYCGLAWEDACLEFHKTDRAVKTASSSQVREEMYKGSSEAWRKYEHHLQPLLQALEGL